MNPIQFYEPYLFNLRMNPIPNSDNVFRNDNPANYEHLNVHTPSDVQRKMIGK